MKQVFSIVLTAALALTTLYSCKKDDDKTADPAKQNKSKAELILGSWSYVSITSDKPYKWDWDVNGTDGMTYRGECMKGSYLTFEKGTSPSTGTFLFYDNCNKYNDSDTWILQENTLTVADDDFQVIQLDNTTLRLSYEDRFFDGEIMEYVDVIITQTFRRK